MLFTFDDGPNVKTTPLVLDALAQHRIRAVFFMVGRMADNKNPGIRPLIERILREGHVIATHTMWHNDLCRVPELEAAADLDDGKQTIERVAKVPTAWFRVPFGSRCPQLELLLAQRQLVHFHWDIDPQEWRRGPPIRTVHRVTSVLGRIHGRNVLLLHDVKVATVQALPKILEWIDTENARRAQLALPVIRIVQAPAFAVEQLPRGLVRWLADATAGVRALPGAIASALP